MEVFKLNYYLIYFFVALLSLIIATQADFKNNKVSNKLSNKLLFVGAVVFIFLYGLRAETIGTDTQNYLFQFNNYATYDFGNDFIMSYIYKVFHFLNLPFQSFLLFMSCLFVGILGLSIHKNTKIFGSNSLLVFFGFISLFYFQSLGINVIRQGVSLSFMLLAMANYQLINVKKINWILPCLLSVSFHFTSIIPIILYILILYFEKIKLKPFYLFYIGCLVLSAISISLLNFKDYLGFLLVDERRASYLTGVDEVYTIGFKPQFVTFNTIFLFIFLFIKSHIKESNYFDSLLKYYLLLSGIFFLAFQMMYSDRWGLMSWVVIPVLLAPIFSSNFPKQLYTLSCFGLILIFIFFENYS